MKAATAGGWYDVWSDPESEWCARRPELVWIDLSLAYVTHSHCGHVRTAGQTDLRYRYAVNSALITFLDDTSGAPE
jgi:hypothetical protein